MQLLVLEVDSSAYQWPKHIGIIPDGNRRWAESQEPPQHPWIGHAEGFKRMDEITDFVFSETDTKCLTFYGFSVDNLKRAEIEKNHLFGQMAVKLLTLADDLPEDVGVLLLGDLTLFENYSLDGKKYGAPNLGALFKSVQDSKKSTDGRYLTLLVGYDSKSDELTTEENYKTLIEWGIEDVKLRNCRYDEGVLPNFDMVIRTGRGNNRLSGFPNYLFGKETSLYFPEIFWPEFSIDKFKQLISEYGGIERRGGK